jgi:polyhydroxyalkanoate synthase subunit PhaC
VVAQAAPASPARATVSLHSAAHTASMGDIDHAAGTIGGANPFIGLSRAQVGAALARWAGRLLADPAVATDHALRLGGGLVRVAAGASNAEPERGDRRFADAAFQSNRLYRRLLQAYLVWRAELLATVDDLSLDERSADRARFALSLLTEAAAPTNTLLGNPAALKRAFDTGGASLLRGARNVVDDLRHNGGMPSMVDRRPFQVGATVAISPGAVVFRNDVLELIQYLPSTTSVRQRPTLVIPPQINKFYVLDLAPGRSFVEHAVSRGIPFFVISWRNPTPAQRSWGLDTYLQAALEAIDATLEIAHSDDLNILSMCAGGLTAACLLGHMAATGDTRVAAAGLAVTAIDVAVRSQMNVFASPPAIAAARRASARRGVLPGSDMARVFAWMRPNDLVWNYWVNNYLLGERPPAFDVLAWNADTTNLPAQLHADFLHMFLENPLVRPGAMTALGSPVDLGAVTCDVYALGALTDHIVPWQGAYQATQLFGGSTRFVLSSSGHIQAIVNPPGNPKARYFVNDQTVADPAAWLAGATERAGTWWDDWTAWTIERSGGERKAPTRAGSRRHPVLDPAPGRYVRD